MAFMFCKFTPATLGQWIGMWGFMQLFAFNNKRWRGCGMREMVPTLFQVMGPGEGKDSRMHVPTSHEAAFSKRWGEAQPRIPQAGSEVGRQLLDSLETRTFSPLCLPLTVMFNCFLSKAMGATLFCLGPASQRTGNLKSLLGTNLRL